MHFNPRLVALVLSLSVAALTTAFVSLVQGVSFLALLVAFFICFSASFLLFYLTIEFLIMKEIHEAYAILAKLKKKDFKITKKKEFPVISPIKKLNYEIYSYASNKQREIDQLRQLNLYRREFLADVSHELKTPLFAAQGYIHTLLDGAIDDLKVRNKFLTKAAKSLDGLSEMVEDLLTLSKVESGVMKMHFQEMDVCKIIKEVFEQLEGLAHSKKITLKEDKKNPETIWAYADGNRIYQVMVNLVENAIKYGKSGGYVKVSVEATVEEVQITIEDNGKGIPPEHVDRIFERFYRVDKSRSKHKGGSGLGLAIVKHILEAHQSKIKVQSKLNEGTLFTFKLPRISLSEKEKLPKITLVRKKTLRNDSLSVEE